MPHISVKCHPKNITKAQLDAYAKDLAVVTNVVSPTSALAEG